jgi:hypothetical protein
MQFSRLRFMSEKRAPPGNKLALRAVFLKEGGISLDSDFDPLKAGQRLIGQFKSSPEAFLLDCEERPDSPEVVHACTYLTKFEFQYRVAAQDAANPPPNIESLKMAATVTATFASVYIPTPGVVLSHGDDFLTAWGNTALMHQWPYWREFCHSMIGRMQLPAVLVPILAAPTNYPLAIASEEVVKLKR